MFKQYLSVSMNASAETEMFAEAYRSIDSCPFHCFLVVNTSCSDAKYCLANSILYAAGAILREVAVLAAEAVCRSS